jgi:hypothetical protein
LKGASLNPLEQSIVSLILDGYYDDSLSEITEAIRARKQTLGKKSLLTISNGTVGHLTNIKPNYLNGAKIVIVGKSGDRFKVEILKDWLRMNPKAQRYSGTITVDPSCIVFER